MGYGTVNTGYPVKADQIKTPGGDSVPAALAKKMQHLGNITEYDTVLAAASAMTVDGTFFGDPSSSIYNAADKPPETADVQYFVMLDGTTGRRVVLAIGYSDSASGRFVGTRDILNGAWLNDWAELIGRYDLIASDDLNNIKKSGFYRLKGVTSNIPSGCSWGVMVVCGDGSNTLSQTVTDHIGTNMYIRTYYDGTTWSEWKQIATTDSVVNINPNNSAGLDCNALIKDGRYQMQGQLLNSPPWIDPSYGHFYVEVFCHMDSWVRQVAYEVNSNCVYTRLCRGGAWEQWQLIATKQYVDGSSPVITGSYVGTGSSGSEREPLKLVFSKVPKIVSIARTDYGYMFLFPYVTEFLRAYLIAGTSNITVTCRMNGKNFEWYEESGYTPELNKSGVTYHYTAIF